MLRKFTFLIILHLIVVIPASAQAVQPLAPSYIRSDNLGVTFVAYLNNFDTGDADQRYRQALEMGVGWNRYPIYWNVLENQPGSYNWGPYDALVDADRANGLKTNAILLGVPTFYGDTTNIAGLWEPMFADGTNTPAPGKAINSNNPYARYVFEVVSRYRPGGVLAQGRGWTGADGIRVWEAWNEPDLELFWRGSQQDYARLLQVTYIVVKHADPQAQVMFGGLAYGNPDTNDWLRAVLDIYAQDPNVQSNNWYMDIVGLHSYSTSRRTGLVVARVKDTLAAYGIDRPVWVNETGVPIWDDYPGPTFSGGDPASRRLRGTMDQQAAFIQQSAAYAFASGADKVFFHQFYDDCGDTGGNHSPDSGGAGDAFGFYRNLSNYGCYSQHPQPGTPRPAVGSFKTLARVIGNANLTNPRILRRTDGSVFVRFDQVGSNERITFMWNELPTENTITWQADSDSARVFSYDEQQFPLTPSAGNYTVTLPPARLNDDPGRPVGEAVMIGGQTFIVVERVTPDDVTVVTGPSIPVVTPRAPLPSQVGSVLGGGEPAAGGGSLTTLGSDITPPITGMEDLPPVSPLTFTVTWNGADVGGIDRYLVWVRVNEGEWEPWIETSATSGEFTGEPGNTYGFAVWAVDLAGNWSLNTDLQPQAITRVE
jgi:hypothetical protein